MKMVDYLRPRLFEPLGIRNSLLGELSGWHHKGRLGTFLMPGGCGEAWRDVCERRNV